MAEKQRCPARLSGSDDKYRCLLDAGHDGPHRDQYENQWQLTINCQ